MAAVFSFSTYYLIQHKDRLTQVPTVVSLCLVTLVGILAVPVFGLAGFHVVLVARGRTTNEQVRLELLIDLTRSSTALALCSLDLGRLTLWHYPSLICFLIFVLIDLFFWYRSVGLVSRWRGNSAAVSIHSHEDAAPTAVTPYVVHSLPGMSCLLF